MPVPINIAGSPGIFIDEFDDDLNVTLEGDMIVRDSALRLDPRSLFEDGFNRSDITPWTVTGGSPELVDGRLHMNSSSGQNDTVTRSIDHDDLKLSVWMNFTTDGTGGPFITLKFEDKSLRFLYDFDGEEMIIQVIEPGGNVNEIDDRDANIYQDLEFIFRVCIGGNEPLFHLQQEQSPGYAPNWRTAPDEFNRTGNVTEIELGCWGDANGYLEDLMVVDLGSEGTAFSTVIDLPPGCIWDEVNFTELWRYAEDVGTIDVVDAVTEEIIPPFEDLVGYGAPVDIQDIHIHDHPSVKLRARFWLEGTAMPYLHNWSISWKEGGLLWMDSFEDLSRCTTNGTEQYWWGDRHTDWEMRKFGAVGVNHTLWVDDFMVSQESPWSTVSSSGEGSVKVEDGYLWIEGPDSSGEWVGVEWDFDVPGLFLNFDFFVDANGPGGFEIRVSTESGQAFIMARGEDTDVDWRIWDGVSHEELNGNRFWMGSWYRNGEIDLNMDGSLSCGGGSSYAGDYYYFGENFTHLSIKCGQGFDMHFDRLMLEGDRLSGDVVSEEVSLQEGMWWTKARVLANLEKGRLDVLDGKTLEVIPGYGDGSGKSLEFVDNGYDIDIRGIDPVRHPTLRLRYSIHSYFTYSPIILSWQLWWEPGASVFMDPFDDSDGVEWTEDMVLSDGRVTTHNILHEDEINRFDISPWVAEEGVVDTYRGALWTQSREPQASAAALDIPNTDPLGLSLSCFAYRFDEVGPGIELRGEDGRSYTFRYDPDNEQINLLYDNNIRETVVWVHSYYWDDNEWLAIEITFDSPTTELRMGSEAFSVPVLNSFIIDTLVLHSGDGGKVYWDDFVVTSEEGVGTAVTDPISLPAGEGWVWLEVEHASPGNASLSMSMVDADSGVTIPGYEDMQATLFDIGGIDVSEHPSVQLVFEMEGRYRDVPYVDWYRVYWTGMVDSIVQTREFEDIEVMEDTPLTDVLNVTDYFTSTFTDPMDLEYEVTNISDPSSVLPYLEGRMLAIDLPKEDWWGTITFRIMVSTGYLDLTTDPISIIVLPVDDPPVFQDVETVEVMEDEVERVHLLGWLFYDVDTEFMDLMVEVPDGNATVDGMAVELMFETGDFETDLPVIVSDGTTTVEGALSVRVLSVDDAPVISYIGKQYVNEDEVYTLDLAAFVTDEDTPIRDLTVTIDESNCTVDGLLLTFYYRDAPEGGLDLRLTVTVSDGTSSVDATLRVQVMDIPDITFAPEVKEVATQLFMAGIEGTMDFSPYVSDMDTPFEELTIECDHAAVVSCQGLTVTFLFTKSTEQPVDISFTVSDGTYTVPATFKVVVADDPGADPEPDHWWAGGGGVLLIIVIVVILVAVAAYLGMRTD